MYNEGFSVNTDAFDGPLDLLLRLIEKHELDIFDIPMALITEQYLLHMKAMDGLDMDELSGFLLMAATLLYIKAKMLLPEETVEAEDEEDPRAELVNRLVHYKIFRERADELSEREHTSILAEYRGRDETLDWDAYLKTAADAPLSGVVSIERLRDIFDDLLRRRENRTDHVRSSFGGVKKERFTIADRMGHITNALSRSKRVSFYSLFRSAADREEKITTFLALLELIRRDRVLITQSGLFGDILCSLKTTKE